MDAVFWIIAGVVGLMIGLWLGILLSNSKIKIQIEKNELLEQENRRLNNELDEERERRVAATLEASELKTRMEMEKASYQEKLLLNHCLSWKTNKIRALLL